MRAAAVFLPPLRATRRQKTTEIIVAIIMLHTSDPPELGAHEAPQREPVRVGHRVFILLFPVIIIKLVCCGVVLGQIN